MFAQLDDLPWYLQESLCWSVVRSQAGQLTVDDVIRRLHADPADATSRRPDEIDYDDDLVFLEERGDCVIVVGPSSASAEGFALPRLSQGGTVHGVFWLINNFNRLYHAVDRVGVTALDALRPAERWGADPESLTNHLGALSELSELGTPGPDWETAAATVESLTGQRLDADWFRRPQTLVTVGSRKLQNPAGYGFPIEP